MADDNRAGEWRSGKLCDASNCIEVAVEAGWVAVRDSAEPAGAWLRFTADDWMAFISEIEVIGGPGGSPVV